jgi:hypothetical protein
VPSLAQLNGKSPDVFLIVEKIFGKRPPGYLAPSSGIIAMPFQLGFRRAVGQIGAVNLREGRLWAKTDGGTKAKNGTQISGLVHWRGLDAASWASVRDSFENAFRQGAGFCLRLQFPFAVSFYRQRR